jgi:electron transfer flavoprotein beta subunit
MNIVVCIKQVPDTANVKIDPNTHTLIREGIDLTINPFDLNAIEEALRLREKFDGRVTVISMGPTQTERALRDAYALGVDRCVLLTDHLFAGADTLSTAYTLSCGIRKLSDWDLILCGKQAIDGDTAQVGPQLSEILNIPVLCWVRKLEYLGNRKIRVEQETETGCCIVETSLPCLLTVTKEINEPRLASLRGVLQAKRKEVEKWGLSDLEIDPGRVGLTGSCTQVIRVFTPSPKEKGEILEGDPKGVSQELVKRLKDAGVVS